MKAGGRQAMGVPDEPLLMGTSGLDYITLGLVDAEKIPAYELTEEDGKRLAKEYSRVLMRKHRARQAAESSLLRLKKEAIYALPDQLTEAALVPDLSPFPANRFMATLTPPIEGYLEKVMEAARLRQGEDSMRWKYCWKNDMIIQAKRPSFLQFTKAVESSCNNCVKTRSTFGVSAVDQILLPFCCLDELTSHVNQGLSDLLAS